VGSAVPAGSPPNFLCTSTLLTGGGCEEEKRPWLCVSTAQQQLKHPCVINTVFSTNAKHSPILATMKKINSFPAKASAVPLKDGLCTDSPFYLPVLCTMGKGIFSINNQKWIKIPVCQ